MIELAPEEYWIECTYPEIKMYLFCLNIDGKVDWRLPTDIEQCDWYADIPQIKGDRWTIEDELAVEWYTDRNRRYFLIPVRDLKND